MSKLSVVVALALGFGTGFLGGKLYDRKHEPVIASTEVTHDGGATHAIDYVRVTRVIDGDTLVIGEDRYRIWGIDTPERNEDYYTDAGNALRSLTRNGVQCVVADAMRPYDRYHRIVARCRAPGIADVGERMVKLGWAQDVPSYSHGAYADEELYARRHGLGVWRRD